MCVSVNLSVFLVLGTGNQQRRVTACRLLVRGRPVAWHCSACRIQLGLANNQADRLGHRRSRTQRQTDRQMDGRTGREMAHGRQSDANLTTGRRRRFRLVFVVHAARQSVVIVRLCRLDNSHSLCQVLFLY